MAPVILSGGKLAVPLNASENSLLTEIALVDDKSCEDFQNGKTIWIGIYKHNENDWRVKNKHFYTDFLRLFSVLEFHRYRYQSTKLGSIFLRI